MTYIFLPKGRAGARLNRVRCERSYGSLFPSTVASTEWRNTHGRPYGRTWASSQGRSSLALSASWEGFGLPSLLRVAV